MYISKIKLNNFKSFEGNHEIEFLKGMNFLVGNNNSGKTSLFYAIEFIRGAKYKEDYITKGRESQDVSVEIELRGEDLIDLVNEDKLNLKKYQDYLINNKDGTYSLLIKRSSETTVINQKGKQITLDLRNVRMFNPHSKENGIKAYENPSGIDKTIMAVFDPQVVYSDIRNEDYQDFGKTKIVGRIINRVIEGFQNERDLNGNLTSWGKLKRAHEEAFGDNGLREKLKDIEHIITQSLIEQYGEGEVNFSFGLPEIDSFFKTGSILLSENGITTDVSEKGTGMQRALAITLIQVYATMTNNEDGLIEKPMMFFIDEPETFLHPKAQNRLMEALELLSHKYQVFVTTHSPYLLKCFDKTKHVVKLLYKEGSTNRIKNGEVLDLFGKHSPTWGEINYCAFDIPSIEFHNELYGFLQARAIDEDERYERENCFEEWLNNKGMRAEKEYSRIIHGIIKTNKKTLPTYIRNIIHHPENTYNSFEDEELKKSIEEMIKIIKQEA